jgi:hypothetical protein
VTPNTTDLYSVTRTCNGNTPVYKASDIGAGKCTGTAATHTTLSLHAHFNAVGNGINANGTSENANPENKVVTATLSILPTVQTQSGAPLTATDTLIYNPQTGNYENAQFSLVGLGIIPDGDYKATLHVDKYIDSSVVESANSQTIPLSQQLTAAPQTVTLIPGDLAPIPHGDNIVDIQDYNTLIACMTAPDTTVCPDLTVADLNGDGTVDQKDLDVLQGNFGALGASFVVPQFMCSQDPSCAKGSNSLQLCPLQCKIENVPGQ